jgi:hypothetical protein
VGIEIERHDARGKEFKTWQTSKFSVSTVHRASFPAWPKRPIAVPSGCFDARRDDETTTTTWKNLTRSESPDVPRERVCRCPRACIGDPWGACVP